MAKPTTREELSQYCLRQLGAPVLEINLADEQIDDLIDVSLFLKRLLTKKPSMLIVCIRTVNWRGEGLKSI